MTDDSAITRRMALALPAILLAACGFRPALAPFGPASRLQDAILADDPVDGHGYVFVREFEERLGRGDPARYGLSHAISIIDESNSVADGNVSRRQQIVGSVTYALRDLGTSEVVASGRVDSFTGYLAAGTTVATEAARRSAVERLLGVLADQMVADLTTASAGFPE